MLALLVAAVATLSFASSAVAAQLVEFSRFGDVAGSGAGQFEDAAGIAVNRTGAGGVQPGDVYVVDSANRRVQEFSASGEFVRTWGKDVDASDPGTGFEICTAESGHTCQAGTQSIEAGAFSYARGIAIDQSTGNVYVADSSGPDMERVDVYSAEGKFEGAFGWEVNASAPAAELQFCTTATGCQASKAVASAGGFNVIYNGAVALDPGSGNLWVGDVENNRINEFEFTLNGDEEVTGTSFVRALGWDVNATAPAEELQECTLVTGCQAGTSGGGEGQFDFIHGVALDAAGDIYVTSGNNCSSSSPCRVLKFNPDGTFKEVFGPGTGGESACQLTWASGNRPEHLASGIAVEPTSQNVVLTRKTSATSFEICEFDPEGELLQRSPAAAIATNSEAGTITPSLALALGEEGVAYVQAPNPANTAWPVRFFGLVPAAPVELLPATELTATSVTLNGEVTVPAPGGTGYNVAYRFEYSADNGLTWLRAPSAGNASVGSTVPGTYTVHQKIDGLLPNTAYLTRLVSITSYTTTSGEETVNTPVGLPQFSEIRARDADQGSVTLEAMINPSGDTTTYRFEWGQTTAYGSAVPANFEPLSGSGHEPILVTAKLTGLAPGTAYHYRIVARNSAGTAPSSDQIAETLNSCGLPDGRCFELVSPRDAGPVALSGEPQANLQMHFQAATQPGSLAYVIETGLPDSTRGAEVLYRGTRGSGGWSNSQISPPLLAPTETRSGSSDSDTVLGLSHDLSCGFLESDQPLTEDAGTRRVIEGGGRNLYRRNPDGSYTAVSKLPPENPEAGPGSGVQYQVVGISQDCRKVVFSTVYRYPGIAGAGIQRLYEWEEGALRNVGVVPGPSGDVVVEATAGTGTSSANVVSEDGSRVFFSAIRQTSPNSSEIGKAGVFVREDGTTIRDLSESETSTPDSGATYQYATPDGSRVFFTANAGLTTEHSPEGTDLYEYDLETDALTDLSVDHEEGGAQVYGFVGASDDGSHVYFVARGQLVPGKGKTYAQNLSANTYSVYGKSGGTVSYVGTVSGDVHELDNVTVQSQNEWSSQVSSDGRYLLFETSANVTGYESGGAREAYLYDSGNGSEATVCVTCRQDGKPPYASGGGFQAGKYLYRPLVSGAAKDSSGLSNNALNRPQSLVVRGGEPQVFFSSLDRLASGAVEGETNIYQWSQGQVFDIATEPPGLRGPFGEGQEVYLHFVGASTDGTDLYLATPESLTWEDGDQRSSVYDARVGGGFPEPPPPAAPCDATSEGSCQGASSPAGATAPPSASATFAGRGNVVPAKAKKHKKHKKHHKKKHHKKRGNAKRGKHHHKSAKRHANGNRRVGK
jgi:hypothetical protein